MFISTSGKVVLVSFLGGYITIDGVINKYQRAQRWEQATGLTYQQFFRALVKTRFPRRCAVCKKKVQSRINGMPRFPVTQCGCSRESTRSQLTKEDLAFL